MSKCRTYGVLCRTLDEMPQRAWNDCVARLLLAPWMAMSRTPQLTSLVLLSLLRIMYWYHTYRSHFRLAKVLSLSNNGISACMVGGASDMKTQDDAIAGRYPLVFVTPEKVICLHSFSQ